MRWPYCLVLLEAALGTGACLAQSQGRLAGIQDRPIAIRDNSNLCISLRIDKGISTGLSDLGHDFSIQLARAIAELHEKDGTLFLPGSNRDPRIITNDRDDNPLCQRDEYDIHITAAYIPRSDGKPFRFTYSIAQAKVSLSDTVERDLEGEWKTGQLERIGYDPLGDAISRDIRERARVIYSRIQPDG